MILTNKVITTVNYLNIEHYQSIGYNDIICNQKIEISVSDLAINSNIKIDVKCDVCSNEKNINYQKYNKNISKHGFYTCSNKCATIKNKLTNKEKYGDENYVNIKELKKTVKEKYDKITKEIESRGYIDCSRCGKSNDLDNYIKNSNGRYKKICRKCRTYQVSNNRRNRDMSEYYKKEYKKNIHIHSWRNLLKNYLNRKNIIKNDSTYNLLGYTHDELKEHIESLFNDNMSWDNYGEYWQIDHIIPVSSFKDDTPVNIVNSLDNLRPFPSYLNNKKGNKLDKDGYILLNKYKTYMDYSYIKENKL